MGKIADTIKGGVKGLLIGAALGIALPALVVGGIAAAAGAGVGLVALGAASAAFLGGIFITPPAAAWGGALGGVGGLLKRSDEKVATIDQQLAMERERSRALAGQMIAQRSVAAPAIAERQVAASSFENPDVKTNFAEKTQGAGTQQNTSVNVSL